MAYKSGTGQGGKSMQDRELAAKVRTLGLQEIQHILAVNGTSPEAAKERKTLKTKGKKNQKLYETVVSNLSKTVLPRLNEHTGKDGEPMQITGVEVTVRRK